MGLQLPESMDELVYWTSRAIGNGYAKMWVKKQDCPKCGKAKMGKPVGKQGKVKIRAKEYVCTECGHTVEKNEHEETLTAEIIYTCPECGKKGEHSGLFKRKKVKGVLLYRFQCSHCGVDIDVTKKMKAKK